VLCDKSELVRKRCLLASDVSKGGLENGEVRAPVPKKRIWDMGKKVQGSAFVNLEAIFDQMRPYEILQMILNHQDLPEVIQTKLREEGVDVTYLREEAERRHQAELNRIHHMKHQKYG
jgi:hypothetical protein